MRIAIGSDHGGFFLKKSIIDSLEKKGIECWDAGCYSEDSADYPDYGLKVGESVSRRQYDRGIAICKTGIGMSIATNKVRGVRAALCRDVQTAEMSRRHNNANVLVLPAAQVDEERALAIIDVWLETEFEEGRHEKRINKIAMYETKTQE